jgi:hypothetical protein
MEPFYQNVGNMETCNEVPKMGISTAAPGIGVTDSFIHRTDSMLGE